MPKIPNEKLIETLFNYSALRFLEAEKVTLYAPSTREEFTCGYDSKLIGANGFDELYVQFKTPSLLNNDGRSMKARTHQHARLLRYPPRTAYYVAHTFESIPEIQEVQRTATGPADFLRRYCAVEASQFEESVTTVRYYVFHPEQCGDICYKLGSDLGRKPTRPIDEREWINGEELLSRFARGEIGARVVLVSSGDANGQAARQAKEQAVMGERRGEVWVMSPGEADAMASGDDEEGRWGESFRKGFVKEQ